MIDYLELLLNAQEQEEPEEETPDLEPRFFSAIPSGTQAGGKEASPKPAPKKMEEKEQVLQTGLPTADTEFDTASAAESRIRETKRMNAWISKDETAVIDIDMAEAAETGERKVIRAEAAEMKVADREMDESENCVTRDSGGWAAGVGITSPSPDISEIDMTFAAATGIVGLEMAGSQAAESGISGAMAALRRRTLSSGTFGAEEFDGIVDGEASSGSFGTGKSGGSFGTDQSGGSFSMEKFSRSFGTEVSGAPSLYRQMTQAGQAVDSLRQNAQVLTVTENSSAAPGPGAAELDEIFSRDARRYDGGFSLF